MIRAVSIILGLYEIGLMVALGYALLETAMRRGLPSAWRLIGAMSWSAVGFTVLVVAEAAIRNGVSL